MRHVRTAPARACEGCAATARPRCPRSRSLTIPDPRFPPHVQELLPGLIPDHDAKTRQQQKALRELGGLRRRSPNTVPGADGGKSSMAQGPKGKGRGILRQKLQKLTLSEVSDPEEKARLKHMGCVAAHAQRQGAGRLL